MVEILRAENALRMTLGGDGEKTRHGRRSPKRTGMFIFRLETRRAG